MTFITDINLLTLLLIKTHIDSYEYVFIALSLLNYKSFLCIYAVD